MDNEPELDYTAATVQALAEDEDLLGATEPQPKLHTPQSNGPSPEQKAAQLATLFAPLICTVLL